jgi:hypothetical protein
VEEMILVFNRYASAEHLQFASALGADEGLTNASPIATATAILISVNIEFGFLPGALSSITDPGWLLVVNRSSFKSHRGQTL